MTYTTIRKGRSNMWVPAIATAKRFGSKIIHVIQGVNGPWCAVAFKR